MAGGLLGAGLVGGLALAVLSAPYREVQREFGFYRSAEEQTAWAARPADFLGVSPRNRTYRSVLPNVWPEPLFPGFAVLALGVVGLGALGALPCAAAARPASPAAASAPPAPARRRAVLCAAGRGGGDPVAGAGAGRGHAQMPLPYSLLATLPGFSGLRSPVRLVVLAALGWGVLAGWGWRGLLARLERACARRGRGG